MERRIYLTGLATASVSLIAGCSGGGANAVVSGSTNYEETWDVDLEEGDELELEVTLDDGLYEGTVRRVILYEFGG